MGYLWCWSLEGTLFIEDTEWGRTFHTVIVLKMDFTLMNLILFRWCRQLVQG